MSGGFFNEEHPLKIPVISVTLMVFHIAIFDKFTNEEQLKNI